MKRDYLLAVGIMTGNSLDAADVVLSKIGNDHSIADLLFYSKASTSALAFFLRELRTVINDNAGDMTLAVSDFNDKQYTQPKNFVSDLTRGQSGTLTFDLLLEAYMQFVSSAVLELLELAKADEKLSQNYNLEEIDLIGFHGQTCTHCPPSIAQSRNKDDLYTVQIGDGQRLADLTGISVVCDFRSDDIMNCGEAAPLAPIHHQRLALSSKSEGYFPLAFCNAGNTGNVTIVSQDKESSSLSVLGWDVGPFNNYPDKLVQAEKGIECDQDGRIGEKGTINLDLLRLLFEKAVINSSGQNFLLQSPPKSSDPEWYVMIPELLGDEPVDGEVLSFEDRLRTAEYFSAYVFVHSLTHLPLHIEMPSFFALCGGGWNNPVCVKHFKGLLIGSDENPELVEHKELFANLRNRIGQKVEVLPSAGFGYDGRAMEARIFADAAVCRVMGIPFTTPETTGADKPVVCGIIRYPKAKRELATEQLRLWLDGYNSEGMTTDKPELFDSRWSRAAAGWFFE